MQLSIGFSGSAPLSEYAALARLVDEYGFHTLSVFDDLMFRPSWPVLFTIARHTRRVQLGPCVTNPYLTHPALLAEYAALLDEATDGRAYLGIGRGAFLEFLEVEQPRPITAVREAVQIIRRLWQQDRTPFQGEVFRATEDAVLQWQPPRRGIPIMIGTWGPRMGRMAGGVADEVKAGSLWSAAYARHLWTHIESGAKQAGRDPAQVGLVLGPLTSIAGDRAEAKAAARRSLVFYLPYLAPMPQFHGMTDEDIARISHTAQRDGVEAGAALIPLDILDSFALYGTPSDVIASIERMAAESPVTRIEFGMPHGPGGSAEAIHLLGKRVLPHFARKGAHQ